MKKIISVLLSVALALLLSSCEITPEHTDAVQRGVGIGLGISFGSR